MKCQNFCRKREQQKHVTKSRCLQSVLARRVAMTFRWGKFWSLMLLLLNSRAEAVSPEHGREQDLKFFCFNDYEDTVSCRFTLPSELQLCTGYSFRLNCTYQDQCPLSTSFQEFKHRDAAVGQCAGVLKVPRVVLILGETYPVTLWKADRQLVSSILDVTSMLKPRTPKIISRTWSDGGFIFRWTHNYGDYDYAGKYLKYIVTYYKDGEKGRGVENNTTNTECEVLERDLEPGAKYHLSVRSQSTISQQASDSSEEMTFTAADSILNTVIIVLCIIAALLAGLVFFLFVRLKERWWDSVARHPSPALLTMVPEKQKILQPMKTNFSTISLDQKKPSACEKELWWSSTSSDSSDGQSQPSGGRTPDSSLGYAKTVLEDHSLSGAQRAPSEDPLGAHVTGQMGPDEGMACHHSFNNKTYRLSSTVPALRPGALSVVPELQCDQSYCPAHTSPTTAPSPAPPSLLWLTDGLPALDTDFSYQACSHKALPAAPCNDIITPAHCDDIETPALCGDVITAALCGDITAASCHTGPPLLVSGYESFSEAVCGGGQKSMEVHGNDSAQCDMPPGNGLQDAIAGIGLGDVIPGNGLSDVIAGNRPLIIPTSPGSLPPSADPYQPLQSAPSPQDALHDGTHLCANPGGVFSPVPLQASGPEPMAGLLPSTQPFSELRGLNLCSSLSGGALMMDSSYHSV